MEMNALRAKWVAAGQDPNATDDQIIDRLYNVCPPAVKSNLAGKDARSLLPVVDALLKVMNETSATTPPATPGAPYTPPESNPGEVQNPKKSRSKVAPIPTSNLSSATLSVIDSHVNQQITSKEAVSARSHIERLIVDRPAMNEYVPAGTTFVFDGDVEEFIKKHADAVIPEDRAIFDDLCTKLRNKTPLEVNITTTRKVIGYEILTPHVTEGHEEMVTNYYTKETAISFVATETAGYISPRDPDDLSARLAFRFKKDANTIGKASVEISTGRPWLRVSNQKDNLAKPERTLVSARATSERTEGRVRSAISFRKDTGKTYADGKKRYTTVRVPGKVSVPVFERIDTKLEQLFPLSTKTFRLTNSARVDIRNAMSLAMQWFASDPQRAFTFGVTAQVDAINKEALKMSVNSTDLE